MDVVNLEVSSRDLTQKVKNILRNNLIPIEYYGNGVKNRSLQVDYQTFRRVFRTAGSNTVIEMVIDGKEKANILVHDVKFNPVTDMFTHLDFINVRMDVEVTAQIPLEFTGISFAVKDLGGTLMTHLSELEVKCLPKDLVHNIEVNIESLEDFHTTIRVKDVVVPDSIAVLNDPEDSVVSVAAPREEEAEVGEEAGEGEEGSEETEGKEKSEGGDGDEAKKE